MLASAKPAERANQRARTRKDLLAAAARLTKEGRKPTLEEVAEAALVSRATAYRYFPNVEALLLEASFDIAVPDGAAVFGGDAFGSPEDRIDRAEAAIHDATYANETAIRLMLVETIARVAQRNDQHGVPVRQNRRTPLIEAALAPVRDRLDDATYMKLCDALAIIFGPESMIVFNDVLRVDAKTAREVKSWAVRALVRAALMPAQSSTDFVSDDMLVGG